MADPIPPGIDPSGMGVAGSAGIQGGVLPDYTGFTGTGRPALPSSLAPDVASALGNYANQGAAALQSKYDELANWYRQQGYEIDEPAGNSTTNQIVVSRTTGAGNQHVSIPSSQISGAEASQRGLKYDPASDSYVGTEKSTGTKESFVATDLTDLYRGLKASGADLDALSKVKVAGYLGSGSGSGSGQGRNVATYLDVEGLKQKEATRQFTDFVNRVQALYGMQDDEQAYAIKSNQNIAQMNQAARAGDIDPEMWSYGNGGNRPGNARLSDILGRTIPSSIPADYRLNDAVSGYGVTTPGTSVGGLPGGSEGYANTVGGYDFNNPDMGSASALGYASGTGAPMPMPSLLAKPQNMAPPPADPELSWMVGLPLFKGGIFGGGPAMPHFQGVR